MGSKHDDVDEVAGVEELHHVESAPPKDAMIDQGAHAALYLEAIQRYPVDDAIDRDAEKRLKRKLDMRILPLLGICYFFYVRVYTRKPFLELHLLIVMLSMIYSMSTKRPFLTPRFSASRTLCISWEPSIHGYRASSILDG